MQEPLEGISFNFDFICLCCVILNERALSLRSLNPSRRQILLVRQLQDHRAIRLTPNDTKFDQTFLAFKRDLDEKEAVTQSQLKKLKTETKASSSFNFKGNTSSTTLSWKL